MEKELKGVWQIFTLTKEEKDNMEIGGIKENEDPLERQNWMAKKLLIEMPFNWDTMMALLRVVWKLPDETLITILDKNLFLFKFTKKKDKTSFWQQVLTKKLFNQKIRTTLF